MSFDALMLAAMGFGSQEWELRHADDSPYLTRYVLAGVDALDTHDPDAPFSVFVHQIHAADGDRHPHNHPWRWAASLILSGGYTEARNGQGDGRDLKCKCHAHSRAYTVGDLSILRPDDYHRIVEVEPDTVTLFLCGRETHDWGFLVDGVHVPHAEYFKRDDAQHMTHARIR